MRIAKPLVLAMRKTIRRRLWLLLAATLVAQVAVTPARASRQDRLYDPVHDLGSLELSVFGTAKRQMYGLKDGIAAQIVPPKALSSGEPISGPVRRSVESKNRVRWLVLLCKFTDQPNEPRPADWFRQLFTEEGAGMGGMYDYWQDVSLNQITIAGSKVVGWLEIEPTDDFLYACAKKAKVAEVDSFTGVVVVAEGLGQPAQTNVTLYDGDWPRPPKPGFILPPSGWYVSEIASRMAHAFSMVSSGGFVGGELSGPTYSSSLADTWDVTTLLDDKVYWAPGSPFVGPKSTAYGEEPYLYGPSVGMPHRLTRGWVQGSKKVVATSKWGGVPTTVTLAAANTWFANDEPVLAEVPDVEGDVSKYDHVKGSLTVEFRAKQGWDAGIPHDAVLIHLSAPTAKPSWFSGAYGTLSRSALVQGPANGGWLAGQSFTYEKENIKVEILEIDSLTKRAKVRIGQA